MNRKFWIIALISFINSLSFTILIPVLYLYGRQFKLDDSQTSLLFAIYAFAQFFATPIIGKLSDRFGRKPLLIVSLAGTVIANLMAGTAASAAVLFFARFLDGITGGNASVAQAVISDVTTPENRAKAFGINGAAFGLGFILGPAISLIAQKVALNTPLGKSFGASFLVSGTIAAIALLLTIFFLPETLKIKAQKSQNFFDLGLDKLITGLYMPKIGILLVINFLTGLTFNMFTFAFQPYFLQVIKQNSDTLTLMFLMFGVLGVIMQTLGISLMLKRLQIVQILFLGLLIRSVSFALMPIWENVYYFVVVCILFSLLNSVVQPMISALISLNSSPEEQGTVLGINSSYLSISNGFGPVIAGFVVNQNNPHSYGYPLYLAGICTFLVLIFAFLKRQSYAVKSS
ncbi:MULTISPECIES: MFS transporter [Pseudanabaena]|uniref:Major facilitator superfamily MFS_1 n=2 Tax=Pseudanabaena TaxID=1152 RepID=L8MWL1_9CYAN|nr:MULTISPECIES: tetracycline resistance MFS efflux pump [Pseudanabaena]ELS30835.1 major facilitator superfamily MFS_1 [Pseudanabaena biceps PCC 7429]MDG3496903.1 tetracycline resistance MFS efflux pump [Pseudanabaena catenata USMAC16]